MKGRLKFVLATMVLLVSSLYVPSARAASQTFNVLFFNPATGRNPYLMLHGVDTLHKYQFQVGDYMSFGYRPLEVRDNNRRITGVVDYTLVNDFVVAFGITEWLQVGVDFPYVILNNFQDPNIVPPPGYTNEMGLSDLRFELKARIIDPCHFPVGVAVIPFGTVPTGRDSVYLGDPGMTGGLRVAIEGRVSPRIGITGNIGYKVGKKVNFRNLDWQHRWLLGAGLYAQLGKGITVFGEINSESAFEHFYNDRDMNMAEVMAGVKWDIKDTGVTVNAGAGNCIICGVKGAMARSVVGVTYRFNPPKYRQMDDQFGKVCEKRFRKGLTAQQYYDLREKCPPNPADFRPGVDDDACPKYYELRELAQLLWRCPAKPEDFQPGVHDEACNKIFTLSDDYTEQEVWAIYELAAEEMGMRCPQDPADFSPAIHDQACPKYYDLREVAMLANVCPPDPSQYREGADDPACPKYYDLRDQYTPEQWAVVTLLARKDTDSDKINDYLDVCPERKEDYNGFADADGCPDGGVVAVSGGEIRTYEPVYFGFNRYNLTREAEQVIDLVIGAINKRPWIKRVRVSGNADAIGTSRANLRISKQRAERVITYMRNHGVRSNVSLIPVGYGAERPAAPNETERGRALNRRVVFAIDSGRY